MVTIICGIILIIAAVFLVIAVLMQNGKSHGLSGAISGGAETFFGKTKGKTIDRMLSKITTIVSIFFVALVILVYVFQKDYDYSVPLNNYIEDSINGTVTEADDTTAFPEDTGFETEDTSETGTDDSSAPETTGTSSTTQE